MSGIPVDNLAQLTSLCERLVEADRCVAEAEQALKNASENARQIRQEDIPALMSELGVSKIVLQSGAVVTVKDEVYASIPVANRETAFDWLEHHGHGGLIKTAVSATFGKGELEAAKALLTELGDKGLEAQLKREVHSMTLKSFLREQLEKGADIPLEMFGAQPVKVASVKLPKEKEK